MEIAAITSQHASTLDAKRVLEDRQALMTQELNELRARQAETSSAASIRSGELDRDFRRMQLNKHIATKAQEWVTQNKKF